MATIRGRSVIIDNFLPVLSFHIHNTDFYPAESPDGTRTNFSTEKKFKAGTLEVFENGVHLAVGADKDYIEDSDQLGYTLNYAPRSDSIILHKYELAITT